MMNDFDETGPWWKFREMINTKNESKNDKWC